MPCPRQRISRLRLSGPSHRAPPQLPEFRPAMATDSPVRRQCRRPHSAWPAPSPRSVLHPRFAGFRPTHPSAAGCHRASAPAGNVPAPASHLPPETARVGRTGCPDPGRAAENTRPGLCATDPVRHSASRPAAAVPAVSAAPTGPAGVSLAPRQTGHWHASAGQVPQRPLPPAAHRAPPPAAPSAG